MTKANTMQASRKFRKRWPCQKLRVSAPDTVVETAAGAGAVAVAVTVALLLVSFECSVNSISLALKTFRAVELQISQVLKKFSKLN